MRGDLVRLPQTRPADTLVASPPDHLQIAIDSLTTVLAQEYNQLPGLSPQASKSVAASTTDTVKRLLTFDKFEKEAVVAQEKEDTYPPVQPLIYGTYQAYLRRCVQLVEAKQTQASEDTKLTC